MAVTPASQGKRRVLYGFNVAVAITVAFLLLLLVNWFAVWAFSRVPAEVRPWLRYDLTATRDHTLSPQTRRVLSQLDAPLELIGVFPEGAAESRAVTDLLDEYRRFDPRLSVRTLDPRGDVAELRELYDAMTADVGDASAAEKLDEAIAGGLTALDAVIEALGEVFATLETAAGELDATNPGESGGLQVLDGYAGALAGWLSGYESKREVLRRLLDSPLPPTSAVRADLLQSLQELDAERGRLPQLQNQLRSSARDRLLPPAVRDAALRALRQLDGVLATLRPAREALSLARVDPEYERLRSVVQSAAFVVVRSGERVRVVSLEDMFDVDAAYAEPSDDSTAAELLPTRFLGEERLTGAIVSVGLPSPPRLVLVSLDGEPVVGRPGRYNVVAERARASGFALLVWSVVAEPGGSTLLPPPVAVDDDAGPVVWVVVPRDLGPRRRVGTPRRVGAGRGRAGFGPAARARRRGDAHPGPATRRGLRGAGPVAGLGRGNGHCGGPRRGGAATLRGRARQRPGRDDVPCAALAGSRGDAAAERADGVV